MMKWTGIALIFVGLVLRYMIKRRKFYRRTVTGMELFDSYESAWLTRFLEKTIFWVATLMILVGVFFLVLGYA